MRYNCPVWSAFVAAKPNGEGLARRNGRQHTNTATPPSLSKPPDSK
ncbi:uncharacterized protein PgNI_02593 [Pyricularia grisea]|uniref:Uncharacterized protein n=1 Tax=Pyricularia grisea TaxID=148305 RepID=A0A6P8BHD7_PYRGI|nr:uncharacterized protein PgNI_02593 [Pyricularia grisea]TLD16067.1 hypothetical protein PgNI_02593 [Pyricularia grisea]